MNDLITRPDVKELVAEAETILTEARRFEIKTNVSYQLAAEELQRIKGSLKKLEVVRKSITQPMDAAKEAVMDLFRAPGDQLKEAETQIKSAMSAYQIELNKKAEEARREAEAAAAAERERIAIAAAKAAEEGRHDDAVQIAESVASVVAMPVAVRSAPTVKGISFSKVWKFEIVDESLIPRMYLLVDETAIRKVVGALKGKTNIPGVRVFEEDQISSRAS